MMDAFNPADLDLGVQVLGELAPKDMEDMVRSYTDITDSYLLAMPSVAVNGNSYTANVITQPGRFHISQGETPERADEVVLTETAYGGDVHIHENSWPGLFGIISAMQGLLVLMYGMIAVFIFIVTAMTGSKILTAEQKDLGIYKSIGCSTIMLRAAFSLRFGIVAVIGAVVGTILAAMLTDPFVSALMRLAGISNFASHPDLSNMLAPGLTVIFLFMGFSYLSAGRIKKADINVLTTE